MHGPSSGYIVSIYRCQVTIASKVNIITLQVAALVPLALLLMPEAYAHLVVALVSKMEGNWIVLDVYW